MAQPKINMPLIDLLYKSFYYYGQTNERRRSALASYIWSMGFLPVFAERRGGDEGNGFQILPYANLWKPPLTTRRMQNSIIPPWQPPPNGERERVQPTEQARRWIVDNLSVGVAENRPVMGVMLSTRAFNAPLRDGDRIVDGCGGRITDIPVVYGERSIPTDPGLLEQLRNPIEVIAESAARNDFAHRLFGIVEDYPSLPVLAV